MTCTLEASGALRDCHPDTDARFSGGPTSERLTELAPLFRVGLTPRCAGGTQPTTVGVVVTFDDRDGAFGGTLHTPSTR